MLDLAVATRRFPTRVLARAQAKLVRELVLVLVKAPVQILVRVPVQELAKQLVQNSVKAQLHIAVEEY